MKKARLVLLLSFVLMGCSSAKTTAELVETEWALVSMPGYASLPTSVTLEFDIETENLGGTSGCNRYFTPYKIAEDRIALDEAIASTMMACPEPQMQLEQTYLTQLATVSVFKIINEQLVLQAQAGDLVFQPQQ